MSYTPQYVKPYPDGWVNQEVAETTPVTAGVMDNYDEAIENIENYLADGGIYEKPQTGIPETDLSQEVQVKLNQGGGSYTLPIASESTLGGVKVGANLSIDSDGTLNATGGGGGTSDYEDLENKPSINGTTLSGNKTGADLGLVDAETGKGLSSNDYTDEDKSKLDGIINAPEMLAEVYDAGKEGGYAVSDYCIHDLGFYVCTEATIGEWDASKWTLTDVGKELQKINGRKYGTVYGIHILGDESYPASKIKYLEDAIGMTPAHMDFDNDVFDYGDWENAFFMPKPCMLNTDCSVAYYLNPNDYTKKADGTDSDVADATFDGNAMMEWGAGGHIWWKIVPDDNDEYSCKFYVANYQADGEFHDWNYQLGMDRFYTSIYQGSLDENNKLRSISDATLIRNKTASQEMEYAHANGDAYEIEEYVDWLLTNMLLFMIGKSTNSQEVFGKGHCNNSATESLMLNPGTMNTKGMFWGETTGVNYGVKIFGMENFYGNQWGRMAGCILALNSFLIKLTRDNRDGTSVSGYNTDGSGYVEIDNKTSTGTSGGYTKKFKFTENGFVPKDMSGTSTTNYCDGFWFNNSQTNFAYVGGDLTCTSLVGGSCLVLSHAPSSARWYNGARLSCKPLAS